MKKLSALLKKADGEVHAELVCGGSKYFPTYSAHTERHTAA